MNGKRQRRKKINLADLELRAKCGHPHARNGKHIPVPFLNYTPERIAPKSPVVRMESECVMCFQTIVAYDSPGKTPVWRSQRYVIEETPW